MTLKDLKPSISDMSSEEALNLILQSRENRRQKKKIPRKRKASTKSPVDKMSDQEVMALLKQLGL